MLKKLLFFIYLFTLILVSLLPPDNMPDVVFFLYADKLAHCCMYAGLTFLMLLAWPKQFTGKKIMLPLGVVALCGFSLEILQGLSGFGRTFDLWDQMANLAGFFPGWFTWLWVRRMMDSNGLANK